MLHCVLHCPGRAAAAVAEAVFALPAACTAVLMYVLVAFFPLCCVPAGVVMLKYSELLPHHISMLLVALNAYGNTPFDGKLLKVGGCWAGGCWWLGWPGGRQISNVSCSRWVLSLPAQPAPVANETSEQV